jgi:hypothetical protein
MLNLKVTFVRSAGACGTYFVHPDGCEPEAGFPHLMPQDAKKTAMAWLASSDKLAAAADKAAGKAAKTAENLTAAVAKRQAKMAAKRAEKEAARQAAIVEKENRLDAAMAANGGRFALVG